MKPPDSEPKNYSDLYIAYETILKTNSSSKKKPDELVKLGWAEKSELDRFHATAGFYRHGLPREEMKCPELSLAEAEELIRRLLISWAKKLSATV